MQGLRDEVVGLGKEREDTAPSLKPFIRQQLADVALRSTAVASHVGQASFPTSINNACTSMEKRSAVMTSTHDTILKMPAVLSALEAHLDESLACAACLVHISPFPMGESPFPENEH
eukprot:TRINITY_DN1882_c0_g1_i1.p1 TRINITY_DN1882_c0_g1~~TRINITY_DN1882_c0_g1_i1.p1  ORF type:complete len:117 (-),score=3.13 TRINITY_DN1882_c0_g1_i1:106-456(-)